MNDTINLYAASQGSQAEYYVNVYSPICWESHIYWDGRPVDRQMMEFRSGVALKNNGLKTLYRLRVKIKKAN